MGDERFCVQCGKDISLKRREARYCSDRCWKARRRGVDPLITSAKPKRGTPMAWWPVFGVIAGPTLSLAAFRAATVSDRDPATGRSVWEEVEERNRMALRAGEEG